MPCNDGGPTKEEIISDQRKRLDKLAALMCATMHDLEDQGLLLKTRGDAQHWYAEHKKMDAERERREAVYAKQKQIRNSILSTLTAEQKLAMAQFPVTWLEATRENP